MKSVSNKIVRIAPGTSGVSSWNGRVGTVNPANGDYAISQITSASTLADSANINLTGPANEDYLKFDGAQWTNKHPAFYTNIAQEIGRAHV